MILSRKLRRYPVLPRGREGLWPIVKARTTVDRKTGEIIRKDTDVQSLSAAELQSKIPQGPRDVYTYFEFQTRLTPEQEQEHVPGMAIRVEKDYQQPHRVRNPGGWPTFNPCAVARKVSAKERASNVEARESMEKESKRLEGKVWLLDKVQNWSDVKKNLPKG